MSLRLGFHYHVPLYRDESGRLRTPGFLGRFLDSLAGECQSLVCFAHPPRDGEIDRMDYVLQAPQIEWVAIGTHTSVPRRMLQAHQMTRPLRHRRDDLDALLIRGPTPLLPAMADAAGNLPLVLLLVGDYVADAHDSLQPRWRKALIRGWAAWNQARERDVARRALTFVNSQALYDVLEPAVKALVLTQTTTLSDVDFFERADTCQTQPIRLLYTGRLSHAKGLIVVIEATALLVHQGVDLVLDLVGWEESGSLTRDVLMETAVRLGIGPRVTVHGYQPLPALFAFYRQADIFLIASLNDSEGFPRVIWEALAHSLPVVATQVGSIPAYLSDGQTALLVEPRNPPALALAISRLLNDPPLRRTIIAGGFALARRNTLQRRASEMVGAIKTWLETHE